MTTNELIHTYSRSEVRDRVSLLPKGVFNQYGCNFCPWKIYSDKCPYNIDGTLDDLPGTGICKKRVEFILSVLPDYDSRPSVAQIESDYNFALTNHKIEEYFLRERDIEDTLLTLDPMNEEHEQRVTDLRKERDKLQRAWKELHKINTTLRVQQTNSERVKKSEVTVKRQPTPEQFAKWVEGDVKDVTG